MKKLAVLLLVSAGCLSACVSAPTKQAEPFFNDPQRVAQGVTVKHDEFKKTTTYEAPTLKYSEGPLGTQAFLRAFKSNDGKVDIQAYVSDYYRGDWRYYDQAYDSNGNKFPTTVINRKVDTCTQYNRCYLIEDVAITLTTDYLKANTQTGARFKLAGKSGEVVFTLPAAYIEGFLRKLN